MPSYTLVNLREVEDLAPRFGFAPDAESRFARTALELEQSGLSYFRLAEGFRFPFGHRHAEQEEVYVVMSGNARIKVEDEVLDLRDGDALRIPGELTRGIEGGPGGCELLVFGAPNTANKDTEMLPGWWED
jgi:mannose-6-phosphate isomerase-like protein (cupin superfamily)